MTVKSFKQFSSLLESGKTREEILDEEDDAEYKKKKAAMMKKYRDADTLKREKENAEYAIKSKDYNFIHGFKPRNKKMTDDELEAQRKADRIADGYTDSEEDDEDYKQKKSGLMKQYKRDDLMDAERKNAERKAKKLSTPLGRR